MPDARPSYAPPQRLSTQEAADLLGAKPATIRNMIRGYGGTQPKLNATRSGRSWEIDRDELLAYVRDHCPRLADELIHGVDLTTGEADQGEPAAVVDPGELPGDAGDGPTQQELMARFSPPPGMDPADQHIHVMQHVVAAYSAMLATGRFSTQLVTALKHMSGELRHLQAHRRAEREADARTMDRADHLAAMVEIASACAHEINAIENDLPAMILQAFEDNRVKLSDPAAGMRAIALASKAVAEQVRDRIADRVEASGDE